MNKIRRNFLIKSVLVLLSFGVGISAYAAIHRLKIFSELMTSFETETNVSSERAEIRSFYGNRVAQLPQTGMLSEVTPQSVIASTGLGALYCNQMIIQDLKVADPTKRWSHHLVKFDQVPAAGILTDEILNDLLNDYASLFWQRSLVDDELASLKAFANDLAIGLPATVDSTQAVVLGVCSVFVGSFSSISI